VHAVPGALTNKISAIMNAIYFERTGDAQKVLAVGQFKKPAPGTNEVLLKMLGSTINPADILFIAGDYRFKPEFPQIAGLEEAGIIEAKGDGVDLPIGTLVAFLNKETWAEYTVVSKDDLFVLPADFPVEKAVQFALNPVTAWGLLQQANLNPGDYLLLSAGNSVVSNLVARFAIRRNINVIATVRNTNTTQALTAIGVSVIHVKEEDIQERVNSITQGKGVNCVLDPVGGKTGSQLLECLGINGKFIIYGKLDPEPAQFYYPTIQYKNLVISAFGARGYIKGLTEKHRTEMVQSLTTIIGDPNFKMEVTATFAISEFHEAIMSLTESKSMGKVIFKF
jgi:NADPH:quinone reductase